MAEFLLKIPYFYRFRGLITHISDFIHLFTLSIHPVLKCIHVSILQYLKGAQKIKNGGFFAKNPLFLSFFAVFEA
jgi:hypothetical protein